jgi:glycosyltransferase involved in cell wall biosynthesis
VGTPVIASMVGGIPELLGPLESELMYEAQNPQDLASSLICAFQRIHELRKEVTSNCQNIVSIEDIYNTYLGHYLDVIHG